MAAADHGEAVGAGEEAGLRQGRDRLLAGIDQVRVHLVVIGEGTNAQHAVLALQGHADPRGNGVGHQGRDADAQIHIKAVAQLLGRARGHLLTIPRH